MTRQRLSLPDTELAYWHYCDAGVDMLEFDSSGQPCPVPLVHALAGLERVAHSGGVLVMINSVEPEGLYARARGYFDWQVQPLGDGRVRIVFEPIEGLASAMNFGDRRCKGA